MTQCYGITLKEEKCEKYGSYNGYCHKHTNQDLTTRPTCVALNTRGVRCMLPDHANDKCRLHLLGVDWTKHWSIFNDETIVVLSTLWQAEDYFERHEVSSIHPHPWFKSQKIYLTKEVSSMKIDVLIDLINEFAGKDYIWISIDNHAIFSYICIIQVDCDFKCPKNSIYCLKIGKIYEMCHLENQKFF